jgi:hypothetical protein
VSKLTQSSTPATKASSNTTINNTNLVNPTAPPNTLEPQMRVLSAEEINKLQAENSQLRQAIKAMTKQMTQQSGESVGTAESGIKWAKLDGVKGFMINTDPNADNSSSSLLDEQQINSVKSFYSQLRQQLQQQSGEVQTPNPDILTAASDFSVLSSGSVEHPIQAADKRAVVVSTHSPALESTFDSLDGPTAGETSVDEEVAVLDLQDIEWWTIVNPVDEQGNEIKPAQLTPGEEEKKNTEDSDDEGFVVLKERDYVDALADFITKNIREHHPEAARLTPTQLREMLNGTFSDLKEPGTLGKAWQWGKFMYTTYGWGQTAWSLYQQPAMVRLVASGVFQAATWVLVLIL